MSTTEILAELPRLHAHEREQLLRRLCELQENDLLTGAGPTKQEKEILDRALTEFRQDRNPGTPWREVLRQIST